MDYCLNRRKVLTRWIVQQFNDELKREQAKAFQETLATFHSSHASDPVIIHITD
jgi:hypothetical protein